MLFSSYFWYSCYFWYCVISGLVVMLFSCFHIFVIKCFSLSFWGVVICVDSGINILVFQIINWVIFFIVISILGLSNSVVFAGIKTSNISGFVILGLAILLFLVLVVVLLFLSVFLCMAISSDLLYKFFQEW